MNRDWKSWLSRHLPAGLRWEDVIGPLLAGCGRALAEPADQIDAEAAAGIWPPSGRWRTEWWGIAVAWPWIYYEGDPEDFPLDQILRGDWNIEDAETIAQYWGLEAEYISGSYGYVRVALEGYSLFRAGDLCGRRLGDFDADRARACGTWLEACVPVGVTVYFEEV